MYSDIKSIRWVSSKKRAVEALMTDYQATVEHLIQILETSKKTDEKAHAKKIHSDITQVKFVRYMHLMLDILHEVSSTSKLFQTNDLLMFEVGEAIDTLYTTLHAMTVTAGSNINKFYTEFDPDTRLFKGIKLNGPLPKSYEEDNDIHSFLENVSQDILNRFANLKQQPVCLFDVFDFRHWPPVSDLKQIAVHGNSEIAQLSEYYASLLSAEPNEVVRQWQKLKVRVTLRKGHPLAVYQQILEAREKDLQLVGQLLMILMTISPSTAQCERSFSAMNNIKTTTRSRMGQKNLNNQMRIVLTGPELKDFDPDRSFAEWLGSSEGGRHLTYKPREATPSASNIVGDQAVCEEPMSAEFMNEIMTKLKDTETGEKLKNHLEASQCCVQ